MKHKRFSWKLLLTVAVVATVLTAVFAATGVFGALGDTTKVITVKEGSVSCEVDKDYAIRNTGNVPVLVRAKVVVNWLDEEGNILAVPPADASVSVKTRSGWTQFPADAKTVDEGCWYCADVLQPNSKVSLIDEVSSTGGTVRITVLAEAIQSAPTKAAEEVWGMRYSNGSWTAR